ncbi:hypothetical protein [Aeromonas dhakensis]|uniref:hypothetical protein n=1 Tax=Aeromonas dhakensis TaxID=196024 RepID=UPI00342AFD0E
MKIVYPMQLAGENGSSEIASLDEFIKKINGLKSGTFPIGRNRIWHGGIHFSKSGGWHPSGAVRAIADGEIVAYRLATKPAKATRSSEEGKPEGKIDLYTSPSFCLVRHCYEAGEQSKNQLTFYSLYMHIACENSYNSPEAARVRVKGTGVSTYEPVVEGHAPKLTRRLSGDKPIYAKRGADVKLVGQEVKSLLNHKDEPHDYYLVHYVDDPDSLFHIAASQLQQEFPQKPKWMTPPEGKPARHKVPCNTWLRKTAGTTVGSMGLPAGSEVVVSSEPPQMVNLNGGTTEFRKVQVFKAGSGTVKDSANQVRINASKGAVGWLAKSKMGAELAAEPSIPVEFKEDAPVVNRSANPIPVQAGEIIGHWGEHELATVGASGFVKDADSKAVHFEVFVAESDKQALEDCINNKARVTGGQGYLLVKQEVTTYRLINDSQHGFHEVANFGPQVLPLAVKESDIVTHGANNFVKVRERTAADGELAGEFVLQGGDVEVVSQHDWHKLGVKLVDGSSDDDGFLDKADTESEDPQQKEASKFFSTLYDKLVTDRDNDGTLSGNDIKAALADEELAGKLRMLFIKHKSEWVKPGQEWPRLKQELAEQPKLYEYAMQVHNNMAWMEDASKKLGDIKPWFIHPAGMMALVGERKTSRTCDCERLYADKFKVTRYGSKYGPVYWGKITLASYSGWRNLLATGKITENEKAILIAMSDNEGKMDAIQSYDSEVVTAGSMQKTFKDGVGLEGKGELSIQLAKFRDKYPDLYANHMSNCGWIVEGTGSSATTYYVDDLLTGGDKVTGRDLKNLLRKGCDESTFNSVINSKPLAGLLKVISLPEFLDIQVLDFIERLHSAESHVVSSGDIRIKDFIKSDFGRAVVLDHSVNRPGYVKDNFKMAISNFHTKNPNVSLNPHDWAESHEIYEKKLLEEYKITRSMTDSISRYDSLRSKLQ